MVNGEIFEMFLGLPGSGKTLTLNEQVVIPSLLEGVDVYVNYWVNLDLPNLHHFTEFHEIENVRNCVVVFDEIGRILDPRSWDDETSSVRDFFQQHRKRHVDIYGTTQHISLVAKSALVEVDRFIMCEKLLKDSFIYGLFPRFPILTMQTSMTLLEAKMEDRNYIFNFDEEEETLEAGRVRVYWFWRKKLLHRELNHCKKELVHYYCPKCMQRQGVFISRDDTPYYAEFMHKKWLELPEKIGQTCPKHKTTILSIRESSGYDTDYEILALEREVTWKPFAKTLVERPFRGRLTPRQVEQRTELENSNN